MNRKVLMTSAIVFMIACNTAYGQLLARTQTNMRFSQPMSADQQANFDKSYELYNAANQAFDDGNYALAETDARESIAKSELAYTNNAGFAWFSLPRILDAEGKVKEALAAYSEIVDLGQGSDAHDCLPYALLLLKTGQWRKAVDVYNKTFPKDGPGIRVWTLSHLLYEDNAFSYDDPEPVALEADIRISMAKLSVELLPTGKTIWGQEQNLAEYKKALDLEPDSPLAQLGYADGLAGMGRLTEANALRQKIADTNTGDYRMAALYDLGDTATLNAAFKIEMSEQH